MALTPKCMLAIIQITVKVAECFFFFVGYLYPMCHGILMANKNEFTHFLCVFVWQKGKENKHLQRKKKITTTASKKRKNGNKSKEGKTGYPDSI